MKWFYALQINYILRILFAGVCGAVIGYERKNRMKEAGIRTHFIVAVGAALMMVISKYGFSDMMGLKSVSFDPSRVAAQIVCGIGFLGAGIIFIQSQTVIGLTTAAGVWATAGIGMAIGSGLYTVGAISTVIIVVAQMLLHKQISFLSTPKVRQVHLQVGALEDIPEKIMKALQAEQITVLNFKIKAVEDDRGGFDSEFTVELPKHFDEEKLLNLLINQSCIRMIELN